VSTRDQIACERYSYYRIWMSVGGTVRDDQGKLWPILPSTGALKASEKRCLPVPDVNWDHILAPDTSGSKPGGWHWRNCFVFTNICFDPLGAHVLEDTCVDDPRGTGVYGCYWKHDRFPNASAKYSTFFPKGWTKLQVQAAVLDSYMHARFYRDGSWIGPPLDGWGFEVRGWVNPAGSDNVTTAYPNRNLNKESRAVQFVIDDPGGDDGGGGDGGGGGEPAEVFVTATTAYGGQPNRTWVWWNSEAEGGIQFCRVAFSTGQPGFDMGPAGGPQYWNTLPGYLTVTCWGNAGGVSSADAETY
jgi:hypothetical protein